MIDLFIQIGLSNACFSLVLAIVAMVAGAKARRPHLAWLLWLLVFVKLLTPPVVTIPVATETVALSNNHTYLELDVNENNNTSLWMTIQAVVFKHGKTGLSFAFCL